MKKQKVSLLFLVILGGFTACNLPVPALRLQETQEVSQQYSTVSALLTRTALMTLTPFDLIALETEQPPWVIDDDQPDSTLTALSDEVRLGDQTPQAVSGNDPQVPCDLAQPGRPIDITVPDDSRFYPGEYFAKTWRLVNAGDCVWTSDYAIVFFSGDNLGLSQAQHLIADTRPGDAVEVTVEMVAPLRPGLYQSNWKLRNSQGQLFGIGPNGASPFWARIVVVPLETETATPTFLAVTPTPMVYASGSLSLQLDVGVDLDTGLVEMDESNDLVFIQSQENDFLISPANDAQIIPFGQNAPGLLECSQAILSSEPVDLQIIPIGSYLCYQTTQGLPGRIYLSAVDIDQSVIDFEFVTWAVP